MFRGGEPSSLARKSQFEVTPRRKRKKSGATQTGKELRRRGYDKALKRALHIEAVTRNVEDEKEPRFSAIQSNKNSQLFNWVKDLVRTLQTSQPNRRNNHQKLSSGGARPKEFLSIRHRGSRENGVEIEITTAIAEAVLTKDEPITRIESNHQHQKLKLEVEISRMRVVASSQRQQ